MHPSAFTYRRRLRIFSILFKQESDFPRGAAARRAARNAFSCDDRICREIAAFRARGKLRDVRPDDDHQERLIDGRHQQLQHDEQVEPARSL